MPRVLITGGAGYIGSVLTELLLDQGYSVTVLDRLFFGKTLDTLKDSHRLRIVRDDIRWVNSEIFNGVDAVLDLAAISNDPAGELDPEKTIDINHKGRAGIARLAKENKVKRYILASSCSIYGFQEGILNENSPVNPLTTYAEANYEAEKSVIPLGDENFSVTVLRQATVYGLSKRMRFDLAINGMTLGIFKTGRIPILRDGTQWRPMVHIKDTSRAFQLMLESPTEKINGQIFNVGSDDQNFQILPMARRIAEANMVPFEYDWYGDPDHRSYRVSFDKIHSTLGYETKNTVEQASQDIFNGLRFGSLTDGPQTRTVDWYSQLLHWKSTLDEIELNDVLL